jgi:hypothetical protein
MVRNQDLLPPELELLDAMEAQLGAGPRAERTDRAAALYHYTGAAGLADVVRSRQIEATHSGFLDDRRELLRGEELVREEAERLLAVMHEESLAKAFLQDFLQFFPRARLGAATDGDVDIFLASFSEQGDDPGRWRTPCRAGGVGYAVGFRELPVSQEDVPGAQARLRLVKCVHDEDLFRRSVRPAVLEVARTFEQMVLTHAKRDHSGEAFYRSAMNIGFRRLAMEIPRLRHRSFAHEAEWRLLVQPGRGRAREIVQFRADAAGALVPYVAVLVGFAEDAGRLRLDRVVVGPGPEAAAEQAHHAARLLLSYAGYDAGALLRASEVPYRGS